MPKSTKKSSDPLSPNTKGKRSKKNTPVNGTHALFSRYPGLQGTLPHVELATVPTPVQKLQHLGKALGVSEIYTKRDDLTAEPYGGNKVRKLEFLLGDALAQGAKEVLTFGCVGSNHATATAICSQRLGLRSINMLQHQPPSPMIVPNLLTSYHAGAELHFCSSSKILPYAVYVQLLEHRRRTGVRPYIIPAGGSAPLGVVGYVNAAFELADQIAAGELPEPARIYVAGGTAGTSAGLILGLNAAQLNACVHVVRVTGESFFNATRVVDLANQTASLLHNADSSFPELVVTEEDFIVRHECYGGGYGVQTDEGNQAVELFKETEGVALEGTYTGKTAAALIKDCKDIKDAPILFWNTFNSHELPKEIANIDYHELPRQFHTYFM